MLAPSERGNPRGSADEAYGGAGAWLRVALDLRRRIPDRAEEAGIQVALAELARHEPAQPEPAQLGGGSLVAARHRDQARHHDAGHPPQLSVALATVRRILDPARAGRPAST
jgi:hypothetical protein